MSADASEFDAGYWEHRYRAGVGVHQRGPSSSLLEVVAELPAGRAVDAGCGPGGDALWLAARGWQVTAVDVSAAALAAGRQAAQALGPDVAERITWVQADLAVWEPGEGCDLVSSHYVHTPGPMEDLVRRLASWVGARGTLLVVGHGSTSDEHGGHARPAAAQLRLEPLATALPAEGWEVVAEPRSHEIQRQDGASVRLHDVVLRARRLA